MNFRKIIFKHTQAIKKINMKTHFIIFLIIIFTSSLNFPQNKNGVMSEVKNNEVKIKLHRLIEFNDSNAKSNNKFLVADITIENISNQSIEMGAEYTMSITIKDAGGNEYRSGLKGEGIVSTYLTRSNSEEQDQKAHNLSFSDKFPAKTKARSLLCGFQVPKDAKIVSFGVKKKDMWSPIK
ncbi:MAG TPA: hypothetical protein DHV28_13235 [Ignavibacteriales bacterium]|nr:hypothetical protein [Ignavibacteriales bacterium]